MSSAQEPIRGAEARGAEAVARLVAAVDLSMCRRGLIRLKHLN